MSRRLRIRLYQPSNCAGAVSACHLFWPGLHQPGGNKKQDEYEDEEEVEEVEEERDEHEDEYDDERVKTMATIMTPPISLDGPICCISTNQSRD